ncbi:hypothetical protein E2C01_026251 [Portunus trituberculatus]|uniref:Uncharacterized protein n=1 Tax=Portunus trituberculatus TaxID=210409 RepID=A0A5B7EI24_PORTR|nr:hypothetical protein [Portunus trituberculatus]
MSESESDNNRVSVPGGGYTGVIRRRYTATATGKGECSWAVQGIMKSQKTCTSKDLTQGFWSSRVSPVPWRCLGARRQVAPASWRCAPCNASHKVPHRSFASPFNR